METNKARQKIAFLLPSLSAGGAERVLLTLMNNLDRARFAPCLITAMDRDDLRGMIPSDIPRHALQAKSVFACLPALFKTLRQERPDILISTMAHMNFAALLLQPFFPQTRFIVREAITPSYFFDGNPLRAGIIRSAYKILYPRADAVISPSQQIINEFKDDLGMTQVNYALLRNPVSPKIFEVKDGPAPWPADGKIHFVASGRLHPQKGFDRLIDALSRFKSAHPWHLHILGQGPMKDELQHAIDARNLSSNVTLEGHKDRPWDYYRSADAFLLPSRWEGLPNVALESLACGTPVIAHEEAGAIAEIAAQAAGNDVCIAHDMDDFLETIMQITPGKGRTAILPETFRQDKIMQQFEDLLASD